jgi:acyl-CoA synthetase (AMP-forming)/AMP-acid ligase II
MSVIFLNYPLPDNIRIESAAVITLNHTLSWSALNELSILYEKKLRDLQLDRIALQLNQDIKNIALLLATTRISNMDFILIPYFYPLNKIQEWLLPYNVTTVIQVNANHDSLEVNQISIATEKVAPKTEPSIGLLTSGTTGVPKISQHNWQTLTQHIKVDNKYIGKKWLLCYPLAHFAGIQVITQCIANGGILIIPPSADPTTLSKILLEHKPDYLNATPTLIKQLLLTIRKEDFAKITLSNITLGGEVVDQSVIDQIKKHFPNTHVSHIYASTELGAMLQITDEKEGFPINVIDDIHFKIDQGRLFAKLFTNMFHH